MTKKYSLTIGWLYPDLMSTYGDYGNVLALQKRLGWRGLEAKILPLSLDSKSEDLKKLDLLFMGGAQDRQQVIVANDLKIKKESLAEHVEGGTPGLYICGAYQFLGKYYKEADGTIVDGLSILDFHTENPGQDSRRLIGHLAFKTDFLTETIIGFENHGGRTYLGKDMTPLGKVIKGFGNNDKDQTEGALYKSTFCTYSHGPILPKNPFFTDYILSLALEKKYSEKITLIPLNDEVENQARKTIASRLNIKV